MGPSLAPLGGLLAVLRAGCGQPGRPWASIWVGALRVFAFLALAQLPLTRALSSPIGKHCIQRAERIRNLGNLRSLRAKSESLRKQETQPSGEHSGGGEPAHGIAQSGNPASDKGVACGRSPLRVHPGSLHLGRGALCPMNYPQVSFEIKALVTLKTFSSRNALHGHAALVRGKRPSDCTVPVDCDRCAQLT